MLGVEDVLFANDQLGPAAAPVLTERGWLVVFPAVDRDDPALIGMAKEPLIAPEAPYEVAGGFRDHVVFPCGLVAEPDGEAKIWYGAGDAVIALATCHVDELLALCTRARRTAAPPSLTAPTAPGRGG